jgi:hypothetical protein
MVLRVASFLAHAATGAAAGWGFLIANDRFKDEKAAEALSGDVATSLKALNASYAFFQGIMAAYYWCVRRARQRGLRARAWALGLAGVRSARAAQRGRALPAGSE